MAEEKKESAQLLLLKDINEAMNRGESLDEVLQKAVEGVHSIFGYEACGIHLLEDDDTIRYAALAINPLIKKAVEMFTGLTVLGYRSPLEGSPFKEVLDAKTPIAVDDMVKFFEDWAGDEKLRKFAPFIAKITGYKRVHHIPLISNEKALGVFGFASKNREYSKSDIQTLQLFSSHLAGIVERKRAEDELKNAYEELKEIDRVKSDIIANVSHELRTPLTIAESAFDMVMDEEDKENRNKLIRLGREALHRQNRIIQNLIEVAMRERADVELKPENLDLIQIASLSRNEMKHQAEKFGVEIKTSMPKDLPMVKADFNALKRVFDNLLDNAIKFNRKGGEVKIKARQKGDFIELAVEDTGIGIAKEHQGKIFDRLYQIDATPTREYGGTGMGLAVAKEIISEHGGSIWVESELGRGSRFCFILDIKRR